jgi:hypothetical protein
VIKRRARREASRNELKEDGNRKPNKLEPAGRACIQP